MKPKNWISAFFIFITLLFLNGCNPYKPEKINNQQANLQLTLSVPSDSAEKKSKKRINNIEATDGYMITENVILNIITSEHTKAEKDTIRELEALIGVKYTDKEKLSLDVKELMGEDFFNEYMESILEYASTTVRTIVIDIRRIEGTGGIGSSREYKILYPQQMKEDEEIYFILDPGKIKVFVYAYNNLFFQNGIFFPTSNIKNMRFFACSEIIDIESEETKTLNLHMDEFTHEKIFTHNITINKDNDDSYRIAFDMPPSIGDLSFFIKYGISGQMNFNKTVKINNELHQEIVLENPSVIPYVFQFNIISTEAESFRSNRIYCPVEVCGKPPLRYRVSSTKLLNKTGFEEGFRIKFGMNHSFEDVKARIYLSEGFVTKDTLQKVLDADESYLKARKIFGYDIPQLIKPHFEFKAYLYPEIIEKMGVDFNLAEIPNIYYVGVLESPSTGEKVYFSHCKDQEDKQNPFFDDAKSGTFCNTGPNINAIIPSEDQKSFNIQWGIYPFVGQNNESPEPALVDVEIYNESGELITVLNNKESILQSPEKLSLYHVNIDYTANGLNPETNYLIRIRLKKYGDEVLPEKFKGFASNVFSTDYASPVVSGGSTIEEAVSINDFVNNNGGVFGVNNGNDEYFYIEATAGDIFSITTLGVSPSDLAVPLTPQVLLPSGEVVDGEISFDVEHKYMAPLTGKYIIKLFGAKPEETPMHYRMIVITKIGSKNELFEAPIPVAIEIPEEKSRFPRDPEDTGMVLIKAGSFQMGDNGGSPDAQPEHEVTISHDFYISDHEVTFGEMIRFLPDLQRTSAGCSEDDCPVNRVNWEQINSYIEWLNENYPFKEGTDYRLCTESEWEYAARAGTTTQWVCGDDPSCLNETAWYNLNSEGHAHPIKQLKPNPWGLYDMYGNMAEFVQDWYAPYDSGKVKDPKGGDKPEKGIELKVLQGGSWLSDKNILKSTYRNYEITDNKDRYYGFRLCSDAP